MFGGVALIPIHYLIDHRPAMDTPQCCPTCLHLPPSCRSFSFSPASSPSMSLLPVRPWRPNSRRRRFSIQASILPVSQHAVRQRVYSFRLRRVHRSHAPFLYCECSAIGLCCATCHPIARLNDCGPFAFISHNQKHLAQLPGSSGHYPSQEHPSL